LEYRRKIESAQLPVGVVNGYAHVCTIMVNFPIMTSGWVANLRAVLELLFFISNIVIAAAVVYGLKQIALTKKIATSDARRESLKFAAERCQYYADHCVPADTKLRSQHQPLNLTYLATGRVPFSIVEGEIRTQFFNDKVWTPEFMRAGVLIADCLNSLEAFAIPFAAGVADDELGYQEAASSFCQLVEQHIAMIVLFRRMGPRYESTIRLYDRWKSRLVAQQTEGQLKKLQELHKQTSEKGKVKQTDDLL
jgi:hypothetical protein